jgi:hypothetical protein
MFEAMDRVIEWASKQARKAMTERSEGNDTNTSSEPMDGSAVNRSVMPTAVDQLAEWLTELDRDIELHEGLETVYWITRRKGWRETRERVQAILDANNASSCEAGRANA